MIRKVLKKNSLCLRFKKQFIKSFLLLATLFCLQPIANAADLLEVYRQAQMSDPIFQQAIAVRFATKEGVPISISALLPNIAFSVDPSVTRSAFAGTNFSQTTGTPVGGQTSPRNNTQRAYTMALTLNQTVFNYAQFSAVAGQVATSKGADATLNAALQSLMIRVASAYFAILNDEDNLSYTEASKLAFAEQLDQAKQQYDVGLKTITDVYTAQASYDASAADFIAAQTKLANDRENLRVITGVYYSHLSSLNENFPLINPKPANVDKWVDIAIQQNWSIKAAQYNLETARQNIKQQFAGHLPTVSLEGVLDRQYTNNINGYRSFNQRKGPGTQTDRTLQLNINVPIFSGGGVLASTNQAAYNFQVASQQLEQTVRTTANTTRQSFLNLTSGISQIAADKQAVKSFISSLEGMEAGYRVGTQTLVDVLNQQQKLFEAQTQYASDRYTFVNNILSLKQAAGTLSFNDLCSINVWLTDKPRPKVKRASSRYHDLA